ncbi:glutamine cyclotransferase [Nitzschia inconspicua]|uniref:glutamate--cysteine ligase n=1 Tax=Nitzschia inconspicua TaxID=303405 RepID=A0A9K3KPL0_9STRA|nr:glutamine cyclotransferase [Nitzschia inconspicua]
MGLLKVGVPKTWDDSKKNLHYVRQAGIRQFVSTYNRVKDLKGDELLWGDEIEYGVFVLDPDNKKIRLSLRAKDIMDELNRKELEHSQISEGCNWVPEYGAWMVEATPNRPYTGFSTDLLRVERNMRLRRKRILTVLHENEIAPTVTTFPLLGALGDDGSVPPVPVGGPVTESEYISDKIINPHPRFGTLTANIRQRRGSKVNIKVPLFRDRNTPEFKGFEIVRSGGKDGCCGSDAQQLWRYGKGDACEEKYGRGYVTVGCSTTSRDEQIDESTGMATMEKWLVDVQCDGCKGLFYRSAPNVIVPDADWPRNGDVVMGYEIPDTPGWIRLQNGYYLPMQSDDGNVQFLFKVSKRAQPQNTEMKRIGSNTPLFRGAEQEDVASLLGGTVAIVEPSVNGESTSSHTANGDADATSNERVRAAVHMDAMAFGMGCCCLQITFQAKDVEESRFLFDQLNVMAPIMMALTASTPILKGRLLDTDARWGIISESVDDRTPAERGRADPNAPYDEYAAKGQRRIYKSRYDSISSYIYQGTLPQGGDPKGLNNRVLNIYNDIPLEIDQDSYEELRKSGVDPALAQHLAHLFIRDPLVIFDGAVEEVDDEIQTDHFESIQSTNWQSVRWKPPPPRNDPNAPHIGWRTEFRSMEIQLTDFENAAFAVFAVLLQRTILTFDLNLYIPISRVDANMQRAHSRNAAAKGKFFFRRHLAPLEEGDDGYGVKYVSMFSMAASGTFDSSSPSTDEDEDDDSVSIKRRSAPTAPGSDEENAFEEMTMAEIMTGKGDFFPGLIPLVRAYLDHIGADSASRERLDSYLDFIEKRSVGELLTPATWIRNFVRSHPAYEHDSFVSDEIAYDLMVACKEIGEGKRHVPELLGNVTIRPITTDGAYQTKLDSKRATNQRLVQLLQRYTRRKSPFDTEFSSELAPDSNNAASAEFAP